MPILFIGLTYADFTPDGKTEAIQGYRFNFIDDDMHYSPDRGIGGESFTSWVTPANIGSFGISQPSEMVLLAPYIGKPVDVHIARKSGKVDGWNVRPHDTVKHADFPPDVPTSVKKLGV